MKNEPVSIKILLSPLNVARPQKAVRQDARNAATSDRAPAYAARFCDGLENNNNLAASTTRANRSGEEDVIRPTKVRTPEANPVIGAFSFFGGDLTPRRLKLSMTNPAPCPHSTAATAIELSTRYNE
jgi:hypothetical protein